MSTRIQRTIILGLIFFGILITGFFVVRAKNSLKNALSEFRGHRPPDLSVAFTEPVVETDVELIRDWMTVPYIAMTYHVHPKTLFDTLGISPRENEEKSLLQLNEEFFLETPGIVIELIKAAVEAHQPIPRETAPTAPSPPPVP